MTPLLQDPATYDSRPSAPTRRGPGRCCPPDQPSSRALRPHWARPAPSLWSHSAASSGRVCPSRTRGSASSQPCHGWSLCPEPRQLPPPSLLLWPCAPPPLALSPGPELGTGEPGATVLVQVQMAWGAGLFYFPLTDGHPDTHISSPPPCAHTHAHTLHATHTHAPRQQGGTCRPLAQPGLQEPPPSMLWQPSKSLPGPSVFLAGGAVVAACHMASGGSQPCTATGWLGAQRCSQAHCT